MRKQDLDKINSKMAKVETAIYSFALVCIATCILLLNIACTQERYDSHKSQLSIDSDLKPYVDAFISAGRINHKNIYINDLVVQFQPDDFFQKATEIGRCTQCRDNKNCTPIINIRFSWWIKKTTSELNKREVMFHELGHCVLNLPHNDKRDGGDYPVSVMNAYQIGDNLYNETTIGSYDTELFTGHNPTAIGEIK